MNSRLEISVSQCSSKGIKMVNEDFYGLYEPQDALRQSKGIALAIADGMGSCENAQEASEHCVKGFLNDYFSTSETWSVKTAGAKVLTALNSWLYSKGNRDHVHGMVTTFSAMVLKSTTAHLFHVGDSRIYRLRAGNLEQLTQDHRVWISDKENYLSRAMGIDLRLDIDYKTITLKVDDLLIMTTDGVHDFLSDGQLREILRNTSSLDNCAQALVDQALGRGSSDNLTCQLARIVQLPSQDANEVFNDLRRLPFPPHLGPGMVIDGYDVLEEIHASTTSQLYKVRDKESGELQILKTPSVNFEDDPAYIERFFIEEWAGKRINNKRVLQVIDRPRQRNFLYFVMEYIDGITLRDWIDQNPKPDINETIKLVGQIVSGLRGIHRQEMLHRDLKPENIMITRDGLVKIIDFGSVKIAGIQEISTPVERINLLGTKNYTAPEYLLGYAGSTSSDLFSLGIIAYEMLTGHLPYGEKLKRNLNPKSLGKLQYTPASIHNPMVPPWLDGAIRKAVSGDYRTRYDTFSEFYYDLTHPNSRFVPGNLPLIQQDPLKFWKMIAAALLFANILTLLLLNR